MAIEGTTATTDPEKTADVVDDATKSGATDPAKKTDSAQGTDPAKNTGWEAEKAAFIRDLQKERKRAQEAETKAEAHARELDTERKRVQALAGVAPKSDADAETDAIRQRLFQILPGLEKLTPEQIDRILQTGNAATDIEQTRDHYWTAHARTMVAGVNEAVAKELGGELTPRQLATIKAAYVERVGSDEALLQRHYEGDKTLIAEFAKDILDDWYEPARRKITATEVNRSRQVPSGRDRSPVSVGGKPIDVTDPKAVEDLLVEGYRKGGGEFGRRR